MSETRGGGFGEGMMDFVLLFFFVRFWSFLL